MVEFELSKVCFVYNKSGDIIVLTSVDGIKILRGL